MDRSSLHPSIVEALSAIEPYSGLNMELLDCSATGVSIAIAFEGNRNDKNTMFAGSIYSAMVLAGWTLARAASLDALPGSNVVIAKSESRFLRPARSDCVAKARAKGPMEKRNDGKRSLAVAVELLDDEGSKCAEFEGVYIIMKKP